MNVTDYNLLSARNATDMNAFVTAATPDGLFVQTMVKTAAETPAG